MDKLLILIALAVSMLMICLVSTVLVYRKLNYSSNLLAKTIEAVEKDLFDDIKQIDLPQLMLTQAGRNLLELLINEQPRQFIDANPPHGKDELDAAELTVLHMMMRGFSDKEISSRLYMSDHTVGVYRSRIMRKLGVPTALEAVRYAMEHIWTSQKFVFQSE